MKNLALTAITAVLVLGACRQTETANNEAIVETETTVNETTENAAVAAVDAAFVTEAMQGDNGEVAIGKLAQDKGVSQKVKDFGKMLANDHGAHKAELATLANSAGIPVTDDPSAEGKTNLDKLKALSGAEFDKTFKSMMIEDHTKDIAKYEKQAESGDAKTAALAKKTLPTLHKHLDTANAL